MFGMAAVVEESFWSFFAGMDLRQHGCCRMRLAEVGTKPTLTGIQCNHGRLLSCDSHNTPSHSDVDLNQ